MSDPGICMALKLMLSRTMNTWVKLLAASVKKEKTSTKVSNSVVPISLYNRYLRFFYYHIIVSLVKIAIFQNDNLIAIKNKDFLLMKIIVISDYFSTK